MSQHHHIGYCFQFFPSIELRGSGGFEGPQDYWTLAGRGNLPSRPTGVHEPTLRRSHKGGIREVVSSARQQKLHRGRHPLSVRLPGGGKGGASADGSGEDEFRFALSDEEFIDLFLEDLELPDLAKRQVMGEVLLSPGRAGYPFLRPTRR